MDRYNYIKRAIHYKDVLVGTIASQITSLTIVHSTVYSDADQRKHQSSASLAFVWEIHRGPVNSPHKWPVTRKMFPFDDVIMSLCIVGYYKTYANFNGSIKRTVIDFGTSFANQWDIQTVPCARKWIRSGVFLPISKMNSLATGYVAVTFEV